uniref:RING-type domain-containing protein n=1 Tax=Eptatretus burgeri TaxID=7764 RepID=A0A8C4R0J3_EPTBU
MGYELQLFPDAVAPELRCKLCAQVLEEPLSAPCGHTFCAACVLPWAAERGTCPAASCRLRSLSPSELSSVPPLRELVLQLRVRCPNASRGCDATPVLLQSVAHAKRCEFSAAPESNLDAEEAALREEALLVRISALYDELQLTALRYKHCLGLYRAQLDHLERTPLPTSVCPVCCAPFARFFTLSTGRAIIAKGLGKGKKNHRDDLSVARLYGHDARFGLNEGHALAIATLLCPNIQRVVHYNYYARGLHLITLCHSLMVYRLPTSCKSRISSQVAFRLNTFSQFLRNVGQLS